MSVLSGHKDSTGEPFSNPLPRQMKANPSASFETSKNTVFKDTTSKVFYEFKGQLSQFTGSSSVVRLTPETANQIFQVKANETDASGEMIHVDSSKALIRSIRVSHTDSNFPYAVCFDMEESNIPSAVKMSNGQACAFVIKSGESGERAIYQEVHTSGQTDDAAMRRYAHVKTDKLRDGIVNAGWDSFSLVRDDHEILKVLALPENQRSQGYNFNSFPRNGKTVIVSNTLVDKAVQELKSMVDQRVKYHDLTNFSLRMRRTDGKPFTDLSGTKAASDIASEEKMALKQFCSASCLLEIRWAYPCREAENSAEPAASTASVAPSSPFQAKLPVKN